MGEEITDEEAEGIIEAVDKDGDGHISYDGKSSKLSSSLAAADALVNFTYILFNLP